MVAVTFFGTTSHRISFLLQWLEKANSICKAVNLIRRKDIRSLASVARFGTS